MAEVAEVGGEVVGERGGGWRATVQRESGWVKGGVSRPISRPTSKADCPVGSADTAPAGSATFPDSKAPLPNSDKRGALVAGERAAACGGEGLATRGTLGAGEGEESETHSESCRPTAAP